MKFSIRFCCSFLLKGPLRRHNRLDDGLAAELRSRGLCHNAALVFREELLELVERALQAALLRVALDVEVDGARLGLELGLECVERCMLLRSRATLLRNRLDELVQPLHVRPRERPEQSLLGTGQVHLHDADQTLGLVFLLVVHNGHVERRVRADRVKDAQAVGHADGIGRARGFDGHVHAVQMVEGGRQVHLVCVFDCLELLVLGAIDVAEKVLLPAEPVLLNFWHFDGKKEKCGSN